MTDQESQGRDLPTGRFAITLAPPVVKHLQRWARQADEDQEPPELTDLREAAERLASDDAPLAADLNRFVDRVVGDGGVEIRRLVDPEVISARRLVELEDRGAQGGSRSRTSLLAFWLVEGSDRPRFEEVRDRLRRQEYTSVTAVWVEGRIQPPSPVDDPPNPMSTDQQHLDPAPGGIDARWAWSRGLDGKGVGFVLLDTEYDLNHVDLPLVSELPGLHQTATWDCKEHGTRALGVVVARDNASGMVGIAPGADPVWAGSYGQTLDYDSGLTTAITAIVDGGHLGHGDVLLLEAQRSVDGQPLHPVEFAPSVHAAIGLAVGAGAVVVEPAGNGGTDLSTIDPGLGDSDAILVASARKGLAAVPPNPGPHGQGHEPMRAGVPSGCGSGPLGQSGATNYGSMVHCYAWGECVATTDCKDGYTKSFAGTSSASAIIAGAALLVQQMRMEGSGTPFTSVEMRKALSAPSKSTHAVPVQNGVGVIMAIGLMPDLKAIVGEWSAESEPEPDPCEEAYRRRLRECGGRRFPWGTLCRLGARLARLFCRLFYWLRKMT